MTVAPNTSTPPEPAPRWPWWVLCIIFVFALVPPLLHVWILWSPPAGAEPTGLHGIDTVYFRHYMRMFTSGFFSPFVTCAAEGAGHDPILFIGNEVYGVVGLLAWLLHLDEFLALGVGNGVGLALYLVAAYFFLRQAAPKQADLAFLVHSFGGGLGGLLFVVTGLLDLHALPRFEDYFIRYAHHELFEGTHLAPLLLGPRLYYSFALACMLASLGCLARSMRRDAFPWLAALLLFVGTYENPRFGPPVWGIAVLWLLCQPHRAVGRRFLEAGVLGAAVVLGVVRILAIAAIVENQLAAIREAVWFSSFLSAGALHILLAAVPLFLAVRRLPRWPRVLSCALLGYLAAFSLLYFGYQAYYGNLWLALEYHATIFASDRALVGCVAGAILGWWLGRSEQAPADEADWMGLWLLVMLVASIGAFGDGWWLRLTPCRLLILAAVPLCVFVARGLQSIHASRSKLAWGAGAALVGLGLCSSVVSVLFFLGPAGRLPGEGSYAYAHYEHMAEADARCLEALGDGTVLSPMSGSPQFGDVISLRDTENVVFGVGSHGLAYADFNALVHDMRTFFTAEAPEGFREELARRHCADWVYCPATVPVDPAAVEELEQTPWLDVAARHGQAVLFRVTPLRESPPTTNN